VEESKEAFLADENRKIKRMLDVQMLERKEILAEESRDRAEEAASLQAKWTAENDRETMKENNAAAAAARERGAVLAFNLAKRAELDAIAKAERDFDDRLLRDALGREAAADARDKAEADARKNAMQEYQRHLAMSLIKEAKDTTKLEALRKEQMEAEWKKREDQWKREADAREKLMREVHAERQLQLRNKAERKITFAAEEKGFADVTLGRVAREGDMERVKTEALNRERRAHQADLRNQIKFKDDKTAAEKQQAYAEYLMMKNAEARYQDALEKLLKSSHEDKSFARKKNEWYS